MGDNKKKDQAHSQHNIKTGLNKQIDEERQVSQNGTKTRLQKGFIKNFVNTYSTEAIITEVDVYKPQNYSRKCYS